MYLGNKKITSQIFNNTDVNVDPIPIKSFRETILVLRFNRGEFHPTKTKKNLHYKAKAQPARKTSPSAHPGTTPMAAPAVDAVWVLSVTLVLVVGDAVGDAVLVEPVDASVDVALLDCELAEAVTEVVVVIAGLDVLVIVVGILLSGVRDWCEPGQLKMEVPPGSGGGVAVQLSMLNTGPLTSDILLAHSGVEQL